MDRMVHGNDDHPGGVLLMPVAWMRNTTVILKSGVDTRR